MSGFGSEFLIRLLSRCWPGIYSFERLTGVGRSASQKPHLPDCYRESKFPTGYGQEALIVYHVEFSVGLLKYPHDTGIGSHQREGSKKSKLETASLLWSNLRSHILSFQQYLIGYTGQLYPYENRLH